MPILDRNKEKYYDSFFSGNITIGLKYSALNPENIYTLKEAEISERLARIHAAAQLRPMKIQNLLQEIENHQNTIFLKERFHNASIHRNENDITIKKLPEKQKKQAVAYADFEYDKDTSPLEHIIEGMEYLAGLKNQLSKASQKAMYSLVPETQEWISKAKPLSKMSLPKKLEIYFEDADKMLTNMQLAVPKYQGVTEDMLKESKVSVKAGISYISRYLEATAGRVLDPVYDRAEKRDISERIHREDLILIGGHTVHRLLNKNLEGRDIYDVKSRKEVIKETALLVAAAIQNDIPVEAFLPNEEGKISREPVTIVRSGCDIKQLTKIKEGFYKKFMSDMGELFGIEDLLAEKEKYPDTLENRESIKTEDAQIEREENTVCLN